MSKYSPSFAKSKRTFGESSGRKGMPMARKPGLSSRAAARASQSSYAMSRKPAGRSAKPLTGTKSSFGMSRKPVTGKMKGTLNSFNTAKKAPTPKRMAAENRTKTFGMAKKPVGSNPKQDSIDKRIGSYFSGIKGGWG